MVKLAKNHNPKYPVQTLEKAMEIIELLYKQNSYEGLGITDFSKRLGIGKSTVHRILDTLVAYGYVEKSGKNNKYFLGWKMFQIGNVVPQQRNLSNVDLDLDVLQELCKEHNETVNLGIRVNNQVVILNKFNSETTLMVNIQVGTHEPIHPTALGKILISEFNKEQMIQLLGNDLIKYTPNTITTVEELFLEVEKIRKQGYAIDHEEYYEGLTCIAMPIKNFDNEIVAAISVSGPSFRLSFNKITDIKNSLENAAKKLSNYLGSKN